jgi:serine protease Do
LALKTTKLFCFATDFYSTTYFIQLLGDFMFQKVTTLFMLGFSLSVVSYAQKTPQPNERVIQVYSGESGSFLGVELREVTKENLAKYQLNEVRGVAVEKVVENSPASKAGLQNLDVIIKFNGDEISSLLKLTRLLSETAPDHQAKITVLRGGGELEFNVIMGKIIAPRFVGQEFPDIRQFPSNIPLNSLPSFPNIGRFPIPSSGDILVMRDGQELMLGSNHRQIGVVTSSLSKQLADFFGVEEGKGVLINSVLDDSPASLADLRAGDVIVEAEGKNVKNQVDLSRFIDEKKEGEVTLTIIRDKQRQSIKVIPEKIKPRLMLKPKKDF